MVQLDSPYDDFLLGFNINIWPITPHLQDIGFQNVSDLEFVCQGHPR